MEVYGVGGGVTACLSLGQGSGRAGLLVFLGERLVALIMNSIIEYLVLYLCRKALATMRCILNFIKVNILHNKRFLNTFVYNLIP